MQNPSRILAESEQNFCRIRKGFLHDLSTIFAESEQDSCRIRAGFLQNPSRILAKSEQDSCRIRVEFLRNSSRILAESEEDCYRIRTGVWAGIVQILELQSCRHLNRIVVQKFAEFEKDSQRIQTGFLQNTSTMLTESELDSYRVRDVLISFWNGNLAEPWEDSCWIRKRFL